MRLAFLIIPILTLISVTSNAQTVRNYSLQTISNEKVDLYDLKGETITVLDFWTTWCKPCKKAIPQLNILYEEYKDQGVQFIGINCDGPRTVAKVPGVSQSLQIQYPVLIDINSDILNALNLSNFPTLVILDKDNKVKYMHEGFIPGDEEEIAEAIQNQLKKIK
jgi:cytochrome c biogenesis protein CcmG/thiol:disulfide interchange protein DsbE